MSRTPEASKLARTLRRGAATVALTGVAILTPSLATSAGARTAKMAGSSPFAAQEHQTSADIAAQIGIPVANGKLSIRQRIRDRRTHKSKTVYKHIDHPVLAYKGSGLEGLDDDPTDGNYLLGSLAVRHGIPIIKLVSAYNPATMHYTPYQDDNPPIEGIVFHRDEHGDLDYNSPLILVREGGGASPALDPNGQLQQIGHSHVTNHPQASI